MDTRTGEVKFFQDDEKLPDKWVLMPPVGTKVEIHFKQRLKGGVNTTRKRTGRVTEIRAGNPGSVVVEMLPTKR